MDNKFNIVLVPNDFMRKKKKIYLKKYIVLLHEPTINISITVKNL